MSHLDREYTRSTYADLQRAEARVKELEAENEALKANLALRQCVWSTDDSGPWETECGHTFEFIDGGPKDNGFKFCCYCGGEMIVKEFSEIGDEG